MNNIPVQEEDVNTPHGMPPNVRPASENDDAPQEDVERDDPEKEAESA